MAAHTFLVARIVWANSSLGRDRWASDPCAEQQDQSCQQRTSGSVRVLPHGLLLVTLHPKIRGFGIDPGLLWQDLANGLVLT